jgi:CRP-like cAMP-binding protein
MHPTEMLIRRLRVDMHLSDEDSNALKALPIQVKEVEDNTPIVSEGDRPTKCCLLIQGFACRSKVADTGRRQILSFHIPGDIPDLQSLFLRTMDHDLTTMSDATVGFIDHTAVNALIDERPSIGRALWRETLIDSAIFREWIVNVGVRPAAGRMAHLLAELRERMASVGLTEDGTFNFPITQNKLAEALGLSAVHVNRVLQSFRARHILDLQKQQVTIANHDAVIAAGGFDDTYLHLTRNV